MEEADNLFNNNYFKEAFNKYYNLSLTNNFDSMAKIGYCYEFGYGVLQDNDKAKVYYLYSAENGSSIGQYYLGCYLLNEKNMEQAIEWLVKSAEQRNLKAIKELYFFYKDKNKNKALEYSWKLARETYIIGKIDYLFDFIFLN
jgi:uncharacterized protein